MSRRLFTVGPVEVFPDTLDSMNRPMMVHRGKDYQDLQHGVVEKIRKVLDVDTEVFLAPASASGFLEGCVRSAVENKMAGLSNGSFGDRWQLIGQENGKKVQKISAEWGKALRKEHVAGKLEKDVEAVTVVSNESSTGILNPLSEIVEGIREQSEALIMVDGVTSVGAVDLKPRKLDLDALVFGSQKALALPPGLAVVCASHRLMEKAAKVKYRGYYLDLMQYKRLSDKDLPLTTPPVSLMYGLDYQLDKILREGVQNRYDRHQRMADMVREWASKRLGLYAEEGYRSNTISVVRLNGMDFKEFDKRLRQKGFEISPGYGSIKDETFRVGHMGDLSEKDIQDLLNVMDEVMEEMA
ncbi:MAG: alanine--glyoxylate aminotransferase family protein [Methanomassiliicoccales archaeon]|nr:alanine--glyoxylate aminotransferase family protein [Methanomassiliicoccales archaeon]